MRKEFQQQFYSGFRSDEGVEQKSLK
jgi:hypothetical protein